jgi:hypothetical protein
MIDIIFFLDMILNFFTTIPQSETSMNEVADRNLIIRDYLGDWFIIDLLSILPIEMIATG